MSDNHFIDWLGPEDLRSTYPPRVAHDTAVEVRFRSGHLYTGSAQSFAWEHGCSHPEAQIVAYRIV